MGRRNHLLSRMQFDHVLKLAQENVMLFRAERKLILRMAHIQQGRYETDQIAALVPFRVRSTFRDHVAKALVSKSLCYRRRALVLTFFMLGIHPALIAEFLMFSRHAIRKVIREYQNGDIGRILSRPSSRIKKTQREDLRDRLFAIMHAPPIEYDINRTTWTSSSCSVFLQKKRFE
jgi:hypothetical protein